MNKIAFFFQERWKYFLGWYVGGYFACLAVTGIPSLSYYIPIKGFAFFFAWMIGNVFYDLRDKLGIGKVYRSDMQILVVKHCISGAIVWLLIALAIDNICYHLLGISSDPFLKM